MAASSSAGPSGNGLAEERRDDFRCTVGCLSNVLGHPLTRGQLISALAAGTGVFASLLSSTNPSSNYPTFMNMLNYVLLSTYLFRDGCRVLKHAFLGSESCGKRLRVHSWYIFAAILDLEANYLVLLAYNYTSITSVMLLDCFTIPSTMLLSYLFLHCKYSWRHLAGALLCLIGLSLIVVSDNIQNGSTYGSKPVLGDVMCLCGAFLYACSNVLQEYLVKFQDRKTFLGKLGLYGTLLAGVQCLIIDRPLLAQATWPTPVCLYIAGFVACLFLMYTNTSVFLIQGDAVLFNLSLLTSDVYAVIFSYLMYQKLVHWLYYVAFGMVAVGLLVYHSAKAPLQPSNAEVLDLCCKEADDKTENISTIGIHGSDGSKEEYREIGDKVYNAIVGSDSNI
jgi:solute carrier family 35 protein F1/2